MDDYGKVVYLDVQKTGSTYVSAFLKAHLNLRHLEFHKHAGARKPIRPDTFYFISTRHPVQQWLSLYQYGCAGKGHIWKRMRRTPQAGVTFDQSRGDFERFLRFALAADNAPALAGGYDEAAPALYGLQTFRFLALCLRAPERKLKEAQTRAHLARIYRNSNFTAAVVKTESLSADLLKLCDGPLAPHLIDRPKAVAFLSDPSRRNATAAPVFTLDDVDPALIAKIREREWFLFERFYDQPNADVAISTTAAASIGEAGE